MNDLSVHPGVYSQIRAYAELVDRVMVDLRRGHGGESTERRLQLGALLACVGRSGPVSAEAKLLEWMIRESGGPSVSRLQEMGSQLRAGGTTDELLSDLESLAQALERERATAFAKMQGR